MIIYLISDCIWVLFKKSTSFYLFFYNFIKGQTFSFFELKALALPPLEGSHKGYKFNREKERQIINQRDWEYHLLLC